MGNAAVGHVNKNLLLIDDLEQLVQRQHHLVQAAFEAQGQHRKSKPKPPRRRTERETAPTGCMIRMWKQDPSVGAPRTVTLPDLVEVQPGPKDPLIEVVLDIGDGKTKDTKVDPASYPLTPDAYGDFANNEGLDPEAEGQPIYLFDLVNVYGVVRMVVNMYHRDLRIPWRWQWDLGKQAGEARPSPIRIVAHAGEKKNAAYLRSRHVLKFGYFKDSNGKEICMCRSLDIVAHEAGHAILDALKPALYKEKEGQKG
eukprot:309137_1